MLRRTKHTGIQMQGGAPLEYTGEILYRRITHILRGPIYGLMQDWVIMSFAFEPSLRLQAEDTWKEMEGHPKEDWLTEVANDDTTLGYWEWVEARIENAKITDKEDDGIGA